MARAWLLALVLTLAQGVIWWLVIPPWTAPDEPGHYLYTRLLADLGRMPTRADNSADIEAPVIASLAATNWWGYENRSIPDPLPERLTNDAVLAASGAQIQDEPPLYYLAPAFFSALAGCTQHNRSCSGIALVASVVVGAAVCCRNSFAIPSLAHLARKTGAGIGFGRVGRHHAHGRVHRRQSQQ